MWKLFTTALLMTLSSLVFAAKVEVAISGMSCGSCAMKITEALNKTGKCEGVKVDTETKKASFETKGEISDGEISKAIEEAGYKATKITRS